MMDNRTINKKNGNCAFYIMGDLGNWPSLNCWTSGALKIVYLWLDFGAGENDFFLATTCSTYSCL